MKRFIEGQDRSQVTLLPECLDDYIGEDNPVRVVDAFVDELDLGALGFKGATAAATGRPSENARSGSWHEEQDIELSRERRRSKNNCRPSSIFSVVSGFPSGTGR